VVCGVLVYRHEGIDDLELYLPLGALARVDRGIGGYPFDERRGVESLTWRASLDRWLADIAVRVHTDAPFQRALIGFEINVDATSWPIRGTPPSCCPTQRPWTTFPQPPEAPEPASAATAPTTAAFCKITRVERLAQRLD
jgi:hypothetical protein